MFQVLSACLHRMLFGSQSLSSVSILQEIAQNISYIALTCNESDLLKQDPSYSDLVEHDLFFLFRIRFNIANFFMLSPEFRFIGARSVLFCSASDLMEQDLFFSVPHPIDWSKLRHVMHWIRFIGARTVIFCSAFNGANFVLLCPESDLLEQDSSYSVLHSI